MVVDPAVEVHGDLFGYGTTRRGDLLDPEWLFSSIFHVMLYGVRSLSVSSRLSSGARGVTEGGATFSCCWLFSLEGSFTVV